MDPLELIYMKSADILDISEPISVSEFIERWRDILTPDEYLLAECSSLPLKAFPATSESIPPELLEELFVVSNHADSLYPPGVKVASCPTLDEVPSNVKLQSVKTTAAYAEKAQQKKIYAGRLARELKVSFRSNAHTCHKVATMKAIQQHMKSQEGKRVDMRKKHYQYDAEPEKVLSPEAILQLNIRRPKRSYGATGDAVLRGKIELVLHALASNTLANIKDELKCPKDLEVPGDFSLNPSAVASTSSASQLFPSSLFFIEDKFYIDKRNIKAQDYSIPIIEWLRRRGYQKELPVLDMTSTKLSELTIRLGQPYVYIHQGDCEHVFQFTDLRLLENHDCQYKQAYPLQVTPSSMIFVICNVCQDRAVGWMVENSPHSPSDPAHYCDPCFFMLHYDKQGKKIGDFRAFRYTDNDFIAKFYEKNWN